MEGDEEYPRMRGDGLKRNCERCAYFVYEYAQRGHCHRNSPIADRRWPVVSVEDLCGQFIFTGEGLKLAIAERKATQEGEAGIRAMAAKAKLEHEAIAIEAIRCGRPDRGRQ